MTEYSITSDVRLEVHVPHQAPPRRSYKGLASEQLAVLAARDDKAAWNELYARHWDWVVQLVLHRAGRSATEDDAFDWAQESMLRAWRYRHTYNSAMSYRRWLRTVVTNHVMSQLNQARRRRELLEGSGLIERGEGTRAGEEYWMGLGAQMPDEYLVEQERAVAIQSVLEQLSKQDREVLKFWSEGRLDEYSEQFRVKPGTVRSRVSRARKRLQEVAQASGFF